MHVFIALQNLLNNFVNSDIMAFVARIFLFFQMVTVFPLLLFILRIQVLSLFFHSVYPRSVILLSDRLCHCCMCIIFCVLIDLLYLCHHNMFDLLSN